MEHNPRVMAALLRHRTDQKLTWGPWWPTDFREMDEWRRDGFYVKEVAGFYLYRKSGMTEKGSVWEKWWVVRSYGGVRGGMQRAWVKMDDKLREAFGLMVTE